MKRLTETHKWNDAWFLELSAHAKLLLGYLYDNCNEAGFIDLNYNIWIVHLNLSKIQIEEALKELGKALISDGNKKIFIKDFLHQQLKLPLNSDNDDHQLIIFKLRNNLEKFNYNESILLILENHVNDKRIPKKNGSKKRSLINEPTYEEFEKYYLSKNPKEEIEQIKGLHTHYKSKGWRNKSGGIIYDWEAQVDKVIKYREKHYNANDKSKNRAETTNSLIGLFGLDDKN